MEYTGSVEAETLGRDTVRSPRVAVLGIGNLLLRDEGVGIHLVRELAGTVDDATVSVIDGGTSPDIPSLVDGGMEKLIIVDALSAGSMPGTIYRYGPDDLDSVSAGPVSLHEVGVLESLRMMALLNRKPRTTVVIGVEPGTIDHGLELSPEVKQKLPELVNLVLREVRESFA